MSIIVINKNKKELYNSSDVSESRFLERDGKAAGIGITDKAQTIRFVNKNKLRLWNKFRIKKKNHSKNEWF